jgi:uncharacterized protein YutE (UPF0331/DUF86 family)
MADDILLNKAQTIEDCIRRVHEEFQGNPSNLRQNQTKQDAIILNIERACQAAIDIGMRVVRLNQLGLPKESREVFDLMQKTGMITPDLCRKMHGLVGFRNTAVHNYRKLDLDIVEAVIRTHLDDLRELARIAIQSQVPRSDESKP